MQNIPRDLLSMRLSAQWRNLAQLDQEGKDAIKKARRDINSFNIRIVASLAGPLFFVFWLGVLMGIFVAREEPLRPYYLAFFGAATAFSFLFLLVHWIKPQIDGFNVYITLSLAAIVGLNILGMYATGDRSVYLLALMVCALLYSTQLRWYVIAFGAAWAASVLGMMFWLPGKIDVNDAVVLAAITVLSIATAFAVELQRDTTEILSLKLKRKNEELQEISVRDPLTGLYNRRFLREWLRQAIAHAERESAPRPLILAIIDLDRFKEINDGAGHAAGDEALKAAAEIFMAGLRRADVIARYGGDEFVAVMPNTTINQARLGIERCQKMYNSILIPSWPDVPSFSCGLSAWSPGIDENELLVMADERLYRAKDLGRNRVVSEDAAG